MGLVAPKPQAQAQATINTAPRPVKLKKGELLFDEGETSRAMYYLKTGIIRIFKKKGDNSFIEIETLRSGQVLGELAFLDGNPRSASAEALTDCELIEISAEIFTSTVKTMPDWLKLLLKTIVSRLRTASTRLRQLETASTSYDYSSKDGKRSAHYVYLSTPEVLKVMSAILLVGSRSGNEGTGNAGEIRVGTLQRYANQIMGVPVAKITSLLDVLATVGVMDLQDGSGTTVLLKDGDFLEQIINFINEQNLLEPSKRQDVTLKGFLIMTLVSKYLEKYPVDPATGKATVNIAEIKEIETKNLGKEPFRMEEVPELVNAGLCTTLQIKAADKVFTEIDPEKFKRAFRMQKVIKAIEGANELKGVGHKK